MGYRRVATTFGPLMVDEATGALLVDAGGFVIEADIIGADMNAVTGTAPNDANLYDLKALLTTIDVDTGFLSTINAAAEGTEVWMGYLTQGGTDTILSILDALRDGNQVAAICERSSPGTAAKVQADGSFSTDIDGLVGLQTFASMYARLDNDTVVPVGQSGTPHYALHTKDASGSSAAKTDWAQLTAPGPTASYQPNFVVKQHVLQITVASINTNVVVRLEGSVDGTNWYNLDADLTITANGVSHITSGVYARYVRGNFVSEAGGTDATVDVDWYGAR